MANADPVDAALPTSLSPERTELLLELATAMHKSTFYPPGHPTLRTAVVALARRLARVLETERSIAIGVADRQLVIDGISTPEAHPHLRALSVQLADQQIGALRFARGVGADELANFLAMLAVDPLQRTVPVGLMGAGVLHRWPHISVFASAFDQLALIDHDDEEEFEGALGDELRAHGASLWIGLAQAALAGEHSDDSASRDPVVVAEAIDTHGGDTSYDLAIVGYMMRIVRAIAAGDVAPRGALQRRVSRLVRTMKPSTLRRLLVTGEAAPRRQFVLDATDSLTVDAVVHLVRVAADVTGVELSRPLVRLLAKLTASADDEANPMHHQSERELRELVRGLLSAWEPSVAQSESHDLALRVAARLAPTSPVPFGPEPCEAERLLDLAFDVDVVGRATLGAVARLIARDGVASVLASLDAAPPSATRARLLDAVLGPELLRTLLMAARVDGASLSRYVERLGERAIEPLLDVVEESAEGELTSVVEALARVGAPSVARIVERLDPAGPASQRHLLAALDRIGEVPSSIDLAEFTRHLDAGVRWEAVRLLLRAERTHDEGIAIGVRDPDERCLALAIRAALTRCPAPVIPVLMRRVDDPVLGDELRTRAYRVIAAFGGEEAMGWLTERLTRRHWLFRTRRLAERSPQLVAALAALASRRPAPEGARDLLALAARSRDAEIRNAVARRVAA